MRCPKCAGKSVVQDTRDKGEVWRRRKCTACDHVFHTQEVVLDDLLKLQRKANAASDRSLILKAIRSLQESIK